MNLSDFERVKELVKRRQMILAMRLVSSRSDAHHELAAYLEGVEGNPQVLNLESVDVLRLLDSMLKEINEGLNKLGVSTLVKDGVP